VGKAARVYFFRGENGKAEAMKLNLDEAHRTTIS
jgi:hypothetical protein